MATIVINDVEDVGNPSTDSITQAIVEAPAPAPAPGADELPEKYRGKSAAEIARMHEEAEKRLGTQGAELGELRKLSDEFLRSTLTRTNENKADSTPTESTIDDAEFFINPKKAIEKAVEQHPLVKELRERNAETQQERAKRTFFEKHPDANDVVQDPEFRTWVEKSPVRMGLLRAAHGFDAVAGDELFSTWKELRALKSGTSNQQETQQVGNTDKAIVEAERQALVRDGTVPSGNANAARDKGGKPIFRRSELIRMRIHEPDRYEGMQDEILMAYQEGRVRG